MQEIVCINESAFIKGRCIHDNYLLMRQVARKINERREAGLFLKLDISRAFDSLSWPFLFQAMRAKGFGQKWISWVAAILSTAMEIFGEASGLRINYQKTMVILIRGTEEHRHRVEHILHYGLGNFPCKYLGIQLAIKALTRPDWQPLLDQVRKCIPAWQRGLIQHPGRLILVKYVIAARPLHQLIVLNAPEWVLEDIEKWMRSFFWAGKDKVNGGQCLVAWSQVFRPTRFGGLGIKDLRLQAIALRVRWDWLKRADPNRPWQGLKLMDDEAASLVLNSLVKIIVGNGARVLFWKDRWIHGFTI
ncbi:Serine/threonine-protein kinase CTR1 [Hordeum vulgare]|nr:Serine/threonine-protein kinase CTR1 [Hordeum vulgare]